MSVRRTPRRVARPTRRAAGPALATALLTVAVTALTSCSDADSGSGGGGGEGGTRSVESEFGTVELPADPQAALGFYTTDVDILITLGIPLADTQPTRSDGGYETFPAFFPQEELAGVETFQNYPEYNYEAVLNAQPDLILNGLGYDRETVDRLPDIAPTYSINAFTGEDWRGFFRTVAEALDRLPEYEEWTARYEARVEEVRARLAEEGVAPVVAPVSLTEDQVTANCYGVPCLVFEDLGLEIAPLAEGQEGTTLSLEQLGRLDGVDAVFTAVTPEDVAAEREPFAALADNTLWNNLPFVENDAIHPFDMEMQFGSPSGQMAFLDIVEKELLG